MAQLYSVVPVQVKAQLTDSIDQRAVSAVDEADRWIAEARSKIAWCAETFDADDCENIEARVSTTNDLCNSVSDGEMIRDTALCRAQNAMQAAVEYDESQWSSRCQQLNDDWMKFTAELQQTR